MSVTVVLLEEAVSGMAPTVFPGIPGVFVPGEPQEVDDETAALIDELGLPFERIASAKPLSKLTIPQLEQKAAELGIELPAGKKDVKVAALATAIAAAAEAETAAEPEPDEHAEDVEG